MESKLEQSTSPAHATPDPKARWNPGDYARHSSGQELWAKELLQLVALEPRESLLDVGCGDGRVTAQIAALAPFGRVVGVDSSAEMVHFAQRQFPAAAHPNLTFVQADAISLPFHSQFDVVFSNAALHWIRHHPPVLAGIARSLKPAGRCVLQMGGKGNGVGVIRAFELCFQTWDLGDSFACPYGFHAPQDYRQWLEQAGLVADSVELIEKDMLHADRDVFTGWLRTAWMPYSSRVAESRRDQFLRDVTAQYLKMYPADDAGQVHVQMVRLQVLAHKNSPAQV